MHGQLPRPAPGDRLAWRAAAVIFGGALVLRLLHLWFVTASPFADVLLGDARGYDAWAQQLAAGDWIGNEVWYQAPLYPYLLGAVYFLLGHDINIVRILQAVLGAAACVLIASTGARLFGQRVGIVAGGILAVYAPAIFLGALIQKSILDLVLMCCTVWLVAVLVDRPSNRHWTALGLSAAALSLTRENALVLAALLGGWAAVSGRVGNNENQTARWHAPLAYLAGLMLLLTPAVARNALVGGGFHLTTSQFGTNLYIGNNSEATGTYRGLREGREDPQFERTDATELAERAAGRALSAGEVSAFWRTRAWQYITAQPLDWLALLGTKVRLLFSATEMVDTEAQESYADYSPLLRVLATVGHFGVLLPLAAIGVLTTWSARARLRVIYLLAIAYAATLLAFYVVARYRYPLIPFAVLFAAAGVTGLRSFVRGASRQRQLLATALFITIAGFSMLPSADADLMRAVTETNLGAALQAQGRLDAAARQYERAVALRPDYFPAHNNLGVVRRAQGRLDAAIVAYQRALEIEPSDPNTQRNLATALLEQGKPEEAAQYFGASRGGGTETAAVHNNFGVSLVSSGRIEQAVEEFRAALVLEPGSVVTLRNLGDALARLKRYPEAVALLTQRTTLAPADPAAHYDLGNVLLEARQPAAAASSFRKVLAIAPQSAQAHSRLGVALAAQGQTSEAIEQFREAIRLQPDFEEARRYLSIALEEQRGVPETRK